MPFVNFTPVKKQDRCESIAHDPPGLILLAPGQHIYECPDCGKKTVVNVPEKKLDIKS